MLLGSSPTWKCAMRPISASERRGAVIAVRPGRGAFDEGRDAHAAVNALPAQLRLFAPQLGVIHALDQRLQTFLVRHVLYFDPGRGDARIGIVGHDVAPAYFDRV